MPPSGLLQQHQTCPSGPTQHADAFPYCKQQDNDSARLRITHWCRYPQKFHRQSRCCKGIERAPKRPFETAVLLHDSSNPAWRCMAWLEATCITLPIACNHKIGSVSFRKNGQKLCCRGIEKCLQAASCNSTKRAQVVQPSMPMHSPIANNRITIVRDYESLTGADIHKNSIGKVDVAKASKGLPSDPLKQQYSSTIRQTQLGDAWPGWKQRALHYP